MRDANEGQAPVVVGQLRIVRAAFMSLFYIRGMSYAKIRPNTLILILGLRENATGVPGKVEFSTDDGKIFAAALSLIKACSDVVVTPE